VLGRPDHIAASPADRAREALLDDATRSNAEIAFAVRSTPQIVKAARAELASYGLLPATPYPQRRFPGHKALPRPPEALMEGACVGHPRPEAWTDPATPADQITAALTCAGCHVLHQCREWSLSLPTSDLATYGGWGASDRERERLRRAGRPLPARLTSQGKNAARDARRHPPAQQQEAEPA
jgi:Transcription factor WhiB